jgi:hypothetical protein
VSLPLGDPRPLRRFERIRAQTRELKRNEAASAIDTFMRFADWTGSSSLTFLGVNLISVVRPYNLIVTNVHGPQLPLYLLGAPLRELHPLLPRFEHQGLAIAAMSYLGRLSFGLSADWNAVDVHELPRCSPRPWPSCARRQRAEVAARPKPRAGGSVAEGAGRDDRERSLKDVITQLEPGLFGSDGLTMKDFASRDLGVFGSVRTTRSTESATGRQSQLHRHQQAPGGHRSVRHGDYPYDAQKVLRTSSRVWGTGMVDRTASLTTACG